MDDKQGGGARRSDHALVQAPSREAVSAASGFDPSRLHGDIKLMLLASPTNEHSALRPTGLSVREWEFATQSGAYRQVWRPRLKEFGFQLTAKGRKMRAAIAIEARSDATGTGAAEGESAAIAQKEAR